MDELQIESTKINFSVWLRLSERFKKTPNKIEFVRPIVIKNVEYGIFKFKKYEDSPWLVGVAGGYIPHQPISLGVFETRFQQFDDETAEEVCTRMIELRSRKCEIRWEKACAKVEKLRDSRNWKALLKFCEESLDVYFRVKNTDKCTFYIYENKTGYLFHNYCEQKNEGFFLDGSTCIFRINAIYALKETKKYSAARKIVAEMEAYAPYDASVKFEYFDIEKRVNDLDKCDKVLDDVHPYIYDAKLFSKYLWARAWVAIQRGKIKTALFYLEHSLRFDGSDESIERVTNEIAFIRKRDIMQDVSMPSHKEIDKFFKEDKFANPTDRCCDFAFEYYRHCLVGSKDKNDEKALEARENLVRLCKGNDFKALKAEVEVFTDNYLIEDNPLKLVFELSKEYFYRKYIEDDDFLRAQYEGENDKLLFFRLLLNCNTEEDFAKKVEGTKNEILGAGDKIVEESAFMGELLMRAIKLKVKTIEGAYIRYYLIYLNNGSYCIFFGDITDPKNGVDDDMLVVMDTLRLKKDSELLD